MDMLDLDKNQGIIDFSKRKMSKINSQKEKVVNSEKTVVEGDINSKLAAAKIHGQQEIEEYKKIIHEAIDKINEMALFKDITPQLEGMCIDYFLNIVIEPIFKGHNIAGLPKSMFLEIRKDIYKEIIEKYCK